MRALGDRRAELDDASKGKATTEELRSRTEEASKNNKDFILHKGEVRNSKASVNRTNDT